MVSESYPEKYWIKYDHEDNPDHLDFSAGKKFDEDIGPITYLMKKKVSLVAVRQYDYLFSDGPDIISANLARLLAEHCPLDIQLLPATLIINDERHQDYFVLNILNTEEAFDLPKCKYTSAINSMPDGPKKFRTIHLKDHNPNSKIFRAAESRFNIILSDCLAKTLEDQLIKGVQFPSEFDGISN